MLHGWLVNYISRYPESLIFETSYWRELDSLRSRVIQILAQLDELISQHKSRLR
jgi:hypothetical protein